MLIPMVFAVVVGFASTAPTTMPTPTATVAASPTPDMAQLTARFTAFFTEVLAEKVPSEGLTDKMQAALTPAVVSELHTFYAPNGTFQKLSFKAQDYVQGFRRYHYVAVFEHGSLGVMFVVDTNGKIAGFFNEP